MTAPREDIVARVREWATHADEDFRVAEHTLRLKDQCPFRLVAYHAQQCAEKYLKGFLVLRGVDFPHTHNIARLLELCAEHGRWTDDIHDAEELTPFAITARYPGDDEPVSESEPAAQSTLPGQFASKYVASWSLRASPSRRVTIPAIAVLHAPTAVAFVAASFELFRAQRVDTIYAEVCTWWTASRKNTRVQCAEFMSEGSIMMRKINAVYEGGVLRPLQSLDGIAEHAHVKITVESVDPAGKPLADCIGTLPDEDAAEMRRIVESEFEQVNLNEW